MNAGIAHAAMPRLATSARTDEFKEWLRGHFPVVEILEKTLRSGKEE